MRQAVATRGGEPWKAIAPEAACELLTRLRALVWNWTPAAVPAVLRELGWVVVTEVEDAGVVADAGLGLGGEEAIVFFFGPGVDSIDVVVTDKTRVQTRPARVFVHDAFADLVAVATAVFGEPSLRTHGEFPRVEWRDDRTTMSIARGSAAVHASVMPNARRDYWDLIDQELPWPG